MKKSITSQCGLCYRFNVPNQMPRQNQNSPNPSPGDIFKPKKKDRLNIIKFDIFNV